MRPVKGRLLNKCDTLPRTIKATVYINGSTTLGVRVRGGCPPLRVRRNEVRHRGRLPPLYFYLTSPTDSQAHMTETENPSPALPLLPGSNAGFFGVIGAGGTVKNVAISSGRITQNGSDTFYTGGTAGKNMNRTAYVPYR